MTVRFCYDSRDEDSENEDPEVISPGREFIEDIECRLQQDIVSTVLQQSKLFLNQLYSFYDLLAIPKKGLKGIIKTCADPENFSWEGVGGGGEAYLQ